MSTSYLHIIQSCLTCKLREERLFCNLHDGALQELNRIKIVKNYPQGATLLAEGEPAEGIMVICQGRVKLSASSADGKKMIINIAEAGEVLGLSSVIAAKPSEATAESLEPVQINFIHRAQFLQFMDRHKEVGLRTAQELSAVHERACRELRLLGLPQSVTQKMALLLLQWAQQASPAHPNLIKVSLTHEEIAQLLGTTRESVNRTLGDLKRTKVISVQGVNVRILDDARLRSIAGLQEI